MSGVVLVLEGLGALASALALLLLVRARHVESLPRAVALLIASMVLAVRLVEVVEWTGSTAVLPGEILAATVPLLWVALLLQLTSSVHMHRARQRESQLTGLFAHAPLPLALFDANGEALYESAAFARLREGAAGGALLGLVEGAGGAVREELVAYREQGRQEWLSCLVCPCVGDEMPAGRLVLAERITASLHAQLEDHQREAELQHRNRIDLMNLLAAGVVHDMRNALTLLELNVDVVADGEATRGELDDSAVTMRQAIGVTSRLLGSLTAMVRKETEAPQQIAVCEMMQASERLLRRSLPRTLELEVSCGTHASVFAVPIKLQQLLLNLVVNGRDACGGVGHLQVRCSDALLGDRAAVSLEVLDDGSGMTEEQIARAFEALYTTKSYGTGLGLAIVHAIVEELGGTARVTSVLGEGTTVRVVLPAVEEMASV